MATQATAVRKLARRDLDVLAEGLVWQDADGRIIDATASAAPILGLTLDELLGRTSHDPRWYAVHEDGSPWPGHDHPGMVALRTGLAQRNRLMGIMAPNSGRRWIRIDAAPQFKPGTNAPVGVVASFVDVTEEIERRHRLEEEVCRLRQTPATSMAGVSSDRVPPNTPASTPEQASPTNASAGHKRRASGLPAPTEADTALVLLESHLERVQAVARIGSFALGGDPDQFTYTRETARLFDLDEHGHTHFAEWSSRIHPDDRPAVQAAWEAALLQGATYDLTYRIVARDQVCWIRARADLERDEAGRLKAAVGTVQDITDLKAIEFELERSRQRLQLALEASGLGTWDYDLRTGHVERDARFLGMIGYAPGELASDYDSFTRIVHPDDLADVEAAALAHFRGESAVYESEHRLRHRDGHYVWVLSTGKVIERGAASQPLRIMGTNRDISQHKRLSEGSIGLLRRIENLIATMSPARQPAGIGVPGAGSPHRLTRRERQIAGFIAAGMTSAEIAEKLHLAVPTVVSHRRNLMAKLKLHSTADVTRFAIEQGLLDTD